MMDAVTGETVRLTPTCPLCHGAMETGYLLEQSHYNALSQTQWVPGEPQRNWLGGISIKQSQLLPVLTLRCVACGFLASYAVAQQRDE